MAVAAQLKWPDAHQAEFIALTQLQAEALATAGQKIAAAARTVVKTVDLGMLVKGADATAPW